MRSGAKKHYIEVERQVQMGVTELNEPVKVWEVFAECFCEVTTLRGKEQFDQSAKRRISEDVYRFRAGFEDLEGVDETMRVDHAGQKYDIKAILPDAQDHGEIIVECTLRDGSFEGAALMGYIDQVIPAGHVGDAFPGLVIKAKGGVPPYSFGSAALPSGLFLDGDTGAITGTPLAAGTSATHIIVSDSAGADHAMPTLAITIT